ncbi:GH92 family glycosyl hydrolase [Labedaea rhizosphaerae]|uniref:Putative alpha-1,2-mannosidase n=1 Tax=Labedaea rhizosphaerae TaxID=598644 RepID=A0A4R6RWJ4_LABRH|nr:GH92 family glycosyl hydrolase [Labedaea rhizosphaerae]TDP91174.1 putative alpha-1,2-mannosidase [Labedaea rhizosphaerae]
MTFFTSFEAGDPLPPTAASTGDGATLRTALGTGPERAYCATTGTGWTGEHALQYTGVHTAEGRASAVLALFAVSVPVEPDTELSYVVFPELPGWETAGYRATHVALDLEFDDGAHLSDHAPLDQHGFALTAAAQGASNTLYPDQWNRKACRLGHLAGRTITRILLRYDHPEGPGRFTGWLDDLHIGPVVHPEVTSPADHVLTNRGTHTSGAYSRGNNIPATAVPNGFNFWIPVTDARNGGFPYAYHRPQLQAIGLSHAPSPWMGDRHTFHVMPSLAPGVPDPMPEERGYPFRHADEIARPYYYKVRCANGVVAEIAPTDHAALLRFTMPGPNAALIFSNLDRRGKVRLLGKVLAGYTDVRSGHSAGAGRMFFYATFDREPVDGGPIPRVPWRAQPAYARFEPDPGGDTVVTMRIATSLISMTQARRNLALELAEDDTVESVSERAHAAWDELLGRFDVTAATDDQLATVYGSLYRLCLYPNSGFEDTGEGPHYMSPFGSKRVTPGKIYVNNGFWDTYRTAWPAYALFAPDRAGELVDGFVQHFRDGGWMSRWSSPGYANLMTGTSSDVAFADVFLKGIKDFDVESAYRAALRNATVPGRNTRVGRKGLHHSIFLGYTPATTHQGLSWTLEGCINDFGIANMAKALGDKDNEVYFRGRALHYAHSFDARIGFFQGRRESGEWRRTPEEHDPLAWGDDYVETDAWNTAFNVPHDGAGLAALHGGREALAAKVDAMFTIPETGRALGAYAGAVHEMREARDLRMGQYAHSNQPSHHILYMYAFTGQPWKTQAKVREVLARLYIGSDFGQGYPGDEDNGEMSAWYLFSALGFYPLQVGSPYYVIGSPLFRRAEVRLGTGNTLTVLAPENSATNVYVQGLKVNGEPHDRTYLSHEVIAAGATLEFAMGPHPSDWGSGPDAAPPSLSSGMPMPPRDVTAEASVTHSEASRPAALTDDTSLTEARLRTRDPWIRFALARPETVSCYTLTSGRRDGEDPSAWVLEGSTDLRTWHELDRRTGQTFPWRRQTRPFAVERPGRYAYYRLRFTGGPSTLAQVELLATG